MPGRKKRLEKGVESIGYQIELHRKKMEEAKESGNIGLVRYYEKEIESMELAIERKKGALKKGR